VGRGGTEGGGRHRGRAARRLVVAAVLGTGVRREKRGFWVGSVGVI
jgi:hypothetical protein